MATMRNTKRKREAGIEEETGESVAKSIDTEDADRKSTRAHQAKGTKAALKASEADVISRINIQTHHAIEHMSPALRHAVFLFAHGAGGTRPRSECNTTMRYVRILQRIGDVVTFDYPAVDIMRYTDIHTTAASEAMKRFPNSVLFLAGHSMGCR